MSKEMVVEVWSKEGDVIENLPKVRKVVLKLGLILCMAVINSVRIVLFLIHEEKNEAVDQKILLKKFVILLRKDIKKLPCLGQNVNAYGKDFEDIEYRFGDLMDDIRKIDIPRIRFTTSHPRDFDDHLIEVLAKGGNLVEHIHLPVQSGITDILKIMARKYTREQYLELVRKIKAAIPNVCINNRYYCRISK